MLPNAEGCCTGLQLSAKEVVLGRPDMVSIFPPSLAGSTPLSSSSSFPFLFLPLRWRKRTRKRVNSSPAPSFQSLPPSSFTSLYSKRAVILPSPMSRNSAGARGRLHPALHNRRPPPCPFHDAGVGGKKQEPFFAASAVLPWQGISHMRRRQQDPFFPGGGGVGVQGGWCGGGG